MQNKIMRVSKNPIIKLVYKLVILVFLCFFIDRLFCAILDKLSARTYSGAFEYNHVIKTKPDIIILGASRAKHHYKCSLIYSATGFTTFNLGYGGTSVLLQYAQLLAIVKQYKPKLIIYEVYGDDFSDFFTRPSSIEPLAIFTGDNRIKTIMNHLENNYKYKSLIKLYKYNNKVFNVLMPSLYKDNLVSSDGYKPLYGASLPQLLKISKSHEDRFLSEHKSPILISAFNDMLDWSDKENLNILFLRSPFYPDKRTNISTEVDTLVLQSIQKHEYSFTDINKFKYDEFNNPNLYKDFIHLTDKGATSYTKKIIPLITKQLEKSAITSK